MIIKHISRFTDNDCVEVIKSLIFTISLACLSSINWASSDWNIAIGIHGNQWEIVTQNAKLPKIKTVYAVAENLREGYGYWARTRGEKKTKTFIKFLELPLILEIVKPGLAFM